jgi:peptidoglycan/xylan/chitin deacetylase (PgdA/CDA1 family)
MKRVDFTFEDFEQILKRFDKRDYTWTDYEGQIETKEVILRHDVDYSPRKALQLAEIEAKHDVTATYFFLVRSPFYNLFEPETVDTVRTIERLGHDIGLHFSTHAHWLEEPSEQTLRRQINAEFELLDHAAETPVQVVAFHNPPDWTQGRTFDSFVSNYEPRFFDNIAYVADSDQRWRKTNPFTTEFPPRVQMLVHPVMWGSRPGSVRDRLPEERVYMTRQIETALRDQNRVWDGQFELDS